MHGTPIEALPAFQFRGAPYGHRTPLPLGSNHPVSLNPQLACKLKESVSALVHWPTWCAGEHEIRHQSFDGDGRRRLHNFQALPPASTFPLRVRLRLCDFLRSNAASNCGDSARNHPGNRQVPAITGTPSGAANSRINGRLEPPYPRTNGFGRFNGQDESA